MKLLNVNYELMKNMLTVKGKLEKETSILKLPPAGVKTSVKHEILYIRTIVISKIDTGAIILILKSYYNFLVIKYKE